MTSSGAPRRTALASLSVLAVIVALSCGACGAGSSHSRATARPPASGTATVRAASAPTPCTSTVVSTLRVIARRAYEEAATGRIVAQARKRVSRSQTLPAAVARGDAAAARAAVAGLLAHQIAFMQVTRGNRVLVRVGRGLGVAPAGGSLLDAGGRVVGHYVLSIQGIRGMVLTASGLTGSQVIVFRGSREVAGTVRAGPTPIPRTGPVDVGGVTYQAVSFPAQAFPSGALRVALLVPPRAFAACAATRDQTVANVYGRLALAVYAGERAGLTAQTAVKLIAASRSFARSVAGGDAARCSAAIEGFFASSRHIVRVRAMRGNRLVCDVGGPFALAPLHGTLRQGGRVAGSFVTSVQDDQGFVLLVSRYTGAQVILRDGNTEIPSSTIIPAPSLPSRGHVTVRGRSYEVFSFTAERFPSGPLRVWLLVPRTGT